MYILVDNYDSFTYNLYHYLLDLGANVAVYRNDEVSVEDILAMRPDGIVLSPGPCTPNEAGICLETVTAAATHAIPLLGVCLGHQAIGQTFGGTVGRAPYVMHGKVSEVYHDGRGVFAGLGQPFTATRYHSLIVQKDSVPDVLHVTAWTDDDLVMGLEHRELPLYGVQFHPESIASEHGHDLLGNFLSLASGKRAA
ncbi:anthranilate synthase component II [Eilatimonas milleporae]|uniref:Anthranilate synthase component II n=1 Tax=Eilatimonas milleporae TaxID=911205 RepID=A0A3M0CJ45_9PROT|nr:aminodeoxychorismate/anthranilate synthase component II [Eilatimonas milleporae]RMB08797.1 anthranilate synthase component II [Eilatimonas milleporae]